MDKVRYHYGTGRRKRAIARVRLYPGTGTITVNGKTAPDYFGGRPVHPGGGTLHSPVDVACPDDDCELDSGVDDDLDLMGDRLDPLGIDAVVEIAHQGLAREL